MFLIRSRGAYPGRHARICVRDSEGLDARIFLQLRRREISGDRDKAEIYQILGATSENDMRNQFGRFEWPGWFELNLNHRRDCPQERGMAREGEREEGREIQIGRRYWPTARLMRVCIRTFVGAQFMAARTREFIRSVRFNCSLGVLSFFKSWI